MKTNRLWVVLTAAACSTVLLSGLQWGCDGTKAVVAPGDANGYHKRGIARTNKGDYDAAISDFTAAIEAKPGYAEAYKDRGAVHACKGDDDQAITDYTKAIQLAPKDPDAYGARAIAYFFKNDFAKASADVKACQERGGKPHPGFLAELRKAPGRKE